MGAQEVRLWRVYANLFKNVNFVSETAREVRLWRVFHASLKA